LAGYFKDNNLPYKFIYKKEDVINPGQYECVYISKVFTFTKEPDFIASFDQSRVKKGGTGYYAEEENLELFNKLRDADMHSLENDSNLPAFNLATQMPDYDLYNEYINECILNGKNPNQYKDYKHFSIGFLTRGCVRKCPFCVNKNINQVYDYSKLSDFIDPKRPYIYLWDDNFLASRNWKQLLIKLQNTNKQFQFRQGLDIRLITEEKASILAKSKYHGDFIFAFDQIKDKELIASKLKIWKKHTNKTTKLYLFCGYKISNDESLINDVLILFERIEILMKYGCLAYVMRHKDYKNHRMANIYVQIARWCNQPQFYKKMSFKEFIERNQFWMKTDNKCSSLRAYEGFMALFTDYNDILDYYFNMRYSELRSPELWEN
jgi:hypothetical protein